MTKFEFDILAWVLIDAASESAPGSVRANAPTFSQERTGARYSFFWVLFPK